MDDLLLSIHMLMNGSAGWALLGCFAWGLVSILLSPCHLASIPLLMAYVSGQKKLIGGWEAAGYAGLFGLGLLASIVAVGLACAAAGRLLGDVPPLLVALIGAGLIALGMELAGFASWQLPQTDIPVKPRGRAGAFVLGAGYGIFSGACTFGFLAPILASAGMQSTLLAGWLMVVVFAAGHCLPIVLAGSFAAVTCRLLAAERFRRFSAWGRRAAGFVVMLIGLYFTATALQSI